MLPPVLSLSLSLSLSRYVQFTMAQRKGGTLPVASFQRFTPFVRVNRPNRVSVVVATAAFLSLLSNDFSTPHPPPPRRHPLSSCSRENRVFANNVRLRLLCLGSSTPSTPFGFTLVERGFCSFIFLQWTGARVCCSRGLIRLWIRGSR